MKYLLFTIIIAMLVIRFAFAAFDTAREDITQKAVDRKHTTEVKYNY